MGRNYYTQSDRSRSQNQEASWSRPGNTLDYEVSRLRETLVRMSCVAHLLKQIDLPTVIPMDSPFTIAVDMFAYLDDMDRQTRTLGFNALQFMQQPTYKEGDQNLRQYRHNQRYKGVFAYMTTPHVRGQANRYCYPEFRDELLRTVETMKGAAGQDLITKYLELAPYFWGNAPYREDRHIWEILKCFDLTRPKSHRLGINYFKWDSQAEDSKLPRGRSRSQSVTQIDPERSDDQPSALPGAEQGAPLVEEIQIVDPAPGQAPVGGQDTRSAVNASLTLLVEIRKLQEQLVPAVQNLEKSFLRIQADHEDTNKTLKDLTKVVEQLTTAPGKKTREQEFSWSENLIAIQQKQGEKIESLTRKVKELGKSQKEQTESVQRRIVRETDASEQRLQQGLNKILIQTQPKESEDLDLSGQTNNYVREINRILSTGPESQVRRIFHIKETQKELLQTIRSLKESHTKNMAISVTRKVDTDKWKDRVDRSLQGLTQCLQTLHLHNPKSGDDGTPQDSQGSCAPLMIDIEPTPPYNEVNGPLQECIEGALAAVGPPASDLTPPGNPAVDMTPDEADWQEKCYPPPSKYQKRESDHEENADPQGAEPAWSRSGTGSASETDEPSFALSGPLKYENLDEGEAFQAVVLAGNTPLNFISALNPADYQ